MKQKEKAVNPDEILATKIGVETIPDDKLYTKEPKLYTPEPEDGSKYLTISKDGYYAWESIDPSYIEAGNLPEQPRPTNCANCGAVLKGRKCEYCGTEY